MRTATKIFAFSASFSLAVAVVYWFVSYERAGSILLLSMFFAPLVMGGYLALRARRAPPTVDDPDADHGAVAGERVGRFHASSAWPLVFALGTGTLLMGLVFGRWLAVVGLVGTVGATLGLMRESHR